MAHLIDLRTFTDTRGKPNCYRKSFTFDIKRIFYIYGVDDSVRGGHRHHKTTQAAICIQGSCKIYSNNGKRDSEFILDSPHKCLLLEPEDWHTMSQFTNDAILMVLGLRIF